MLTDKKKYNQEYYKKNRTRLLTDWKKRYYNPETYGTRKSVLEYQKRYRKTHKKKIKEANKKHHILKREELNKIFERKCFICGNTGNNRWGRGELPLHEIHGKKHQSNPNYMIKHKENFVPLCWKCHKVIHRLAELTDMEIEEILKFVKLIRN